MHLLPHWVLTDKHPSVFDSESRTVIEQTARVYGAMQEMIVEYNAFVDTVNKAITDLEIDNNESINCFKKCITNLIEEFVKSIDTKMDMYNVKIVNATKDATAKILNDKIARGELVLGVEYNEDTESMNIIVNEV